MTEECECPFEREGVEPPSTSLIENQLLGLIQASHIMGQEFEENGGDPPERINNEMLVALFAFAEAGRDALKILSAYMEAKGAKTDRDDEVMFG